MSGKNVCLDIPEEAIPLLNRLLLEEEARLSGRKRDTCRSGDWIDRELKMIDTMKLSIGQAR
jgi:hypothetical protein